MPANVSPSSCGQMSPQSATAPDASNSAAGNPSTQTHGSSGAPSQCGSSSHPAGGSEVGDSVCSGTGAGMSGALGSSPQPASRSAAATTDPRDRLRRMATPSLMWSETEAAELFRIALPFFRDLDPK
jgi:hypothetical protein